jgi:hypothetical protein
MATFDFTDMPDPEELLRENAARRPIECLSLRTQEERLAARKGARAIVEQAPGEVRYINPTVSEWLVLDETFVLLVGNRLRTQALAVMSRTDPNAEPRVFINPTPAMLADLRARVRGMRQPKEDTPCN